MSWTADGSALSDHTTFQRVLNAGNFEPRGSNFDIPGRYGEYRTPKRYGGSTILFEVGIIHDSAETHLSALKEMFNGYTLLARTDHPAGTVQAYVELDSGFRETANRFTYILPLRRPAGMWEDASAHTASGTAPSITTSGDSDVDDMVVTFSAPGTATLVDSELGTATYEWAGSGTAIMDCGARTVMQGGSAVDYDFTVTGFWPVFRPEDTPSFTATASMTVDWRNKHV